jgi:hypothetical protein
MHDKFVLSIILSLWNIEDILVRWSVFKDLSQERIVGSRYSALIKIFHNFQLKYVVYSVENEIVSGFFL